MIPLLGLFIVAAPAQTCPAVTVQEVTAALQSFGETGTWAVEGPVHPYPTVPYAGC